MISFLKKYRYDIVIFLIIAVLAVVFLMGRDQMGLLQEREDFEGFVRSFGPIAPLVVILTIIVEVIVAPIPGFIPIISAGFIFGPIEGSIYALTGNVIGSAAAFFLSRKFGRPLVSKLIDKERLDKYEIAVSRQENLLLLFYFIPIFPIDVISFAFGLSKIKFKKFFIITSVGFVFHVLILNLFGDYLAQLYF